MAVFVAFSRQGHYNLPMDYCIVFFACALGSFLNVACGFGLGVVCIVALPYIMGSTTGPAALVNIITIWQAGWFSWRYRRHIRWRVTVPALIGYFIASTAAVWLSVRADFSVMKRLLAVFLLGASVYLAFFSDRLRLRPTVRNGVLSGLVGGVSSGLFAVGGPPAALYFSATCEDKLGYLANIQVFYLISNTYATAARAVNGVITPYVLLCAAVGSVGMALGSVLGARAFHRSDERRLLHGIYAMMAVSGAVMLFT